MTINNKKLLSIVLLLLICIVALRYIIRTPQASLHTKDGSIYQITQGTANYRIPYLRLDSANQTRTKNGQPNKKSVYLSVQQTGIIGNFGFNQIDNPADNIFIINLDQKPTERDCIWLTYNLSGLHDNSNVPCSVNDRLSFGGYFVKKSSRTNRQRVKLSSGCLQKGENRILFSLPKNADYGYKITDLSIEVEKNTNYSPLIVNTEPIIYDDKAYIHGFINKSKAKRVKVTIGGRPIVTRDFEFETIIELDGKRHLKVNAEIDGEIYSEEIQFKQNIQADKILVINDSIEKSIKFFQRGKVNELLIRNAKLVVGKDALQVDKNLSLTSLRDIDLPALDMGIINVTDGHQGFRFLPHGEHFKDAATVTLKYDRTKIPNGYTEKDIKTFYFDPNTKHWIALECDSVDRNLCLVVSKTTHFTDMINGVIKTPESPETSGFAPTTMSDIKAADPASKIQLIMPPTANNTGSANLTYDLETPPARNRMNPKLTIQYNSDAGSGWLGEGWNLDISSITVDTRWGVPRYSKTHETETYSIGGVMLATTLKSDYIRQNDTIFKVGEATAGHRTYSEGRYRNRQFYPRTEGEFSKIIRRGSSPCNYTWEVTDKNGTIYTYGGDSAELSGSVRGHDSLVIAEWKLKRIQEIHGDYIQFYYVVKNEPISDNLNAKSIYLTRIEAGNAATSPHTIIYFTSDSIKTKRTNNARYGFLTSKNNLLNEVTIYFEKENGAGYNKLRSYLFKYKEGDFGTTLLDSVIHKDNNGLIFAAHKLKYYDNTEDALFKDDECLNIGRVEKGKYSAITDKIDRTIFSDKGSALGATQTTSVGGSLYVGIGKGGLKDVTNLNTIGINAGLSASKTNGKSTLIDINGDGLLDYVYIDNGKMFFKAQIRNKNSEPTFHPAIEIIGAKSFSESLSTTISGGAESKFFCVKLGADVSKTFSKTKVYFCDVNSDGLVDIVNNGRVLFNIVKVIDGIAVPSFTKSSRYTPNPISNDKTGFAEEYAKELQYVSDNKSILFDQQTALAEEQEEILSAVPLQDIVRVWEAPYSGTIHIDGSVKLLLPTENYDTTAYKYADGVRVAIQVGNEEKWWKKISKGDGNYYQPENVSEISINKGQKVYFRVQSGDSITSDGFFDNVVWSPSIYYINSTEQFDANSYSNTGFHCTEGIISKFGYNQIDTLLSTIRVRGYFQKPVTTDSIKLKVFLSNDSIICTDSGFVTNTNYLQEEVFSRTFDAAFTQSSELFFDIDNSIIQGRNLRFEISSESNVRWESINWVPQIYYSHDGKDTVINMGVKIRAFSKCIQDGFEGTISHNGGILRITQIQEEPDWIRLVLKGSNGNIKKVEFDPEVVTETLDLYLPEDIYKIEAYLIKDPKNLIFTYPFTLKMGSISYEIKTFSENDNLDYGPMWRGWGQFEYNADSSRFAYPIDELQLRLPNDTANISLKNMAFFPMFPDIPTKSSWRGLNDYLSIKGDTISCGRLNMTTMVDIFSAISKDDLLRSAGGNNYLYVSANKSPESIPYDEIIDAPILLTNNKSTCGYAASISNISSGSSEMIASYMDMNGDGYPDKILKSENQYKIYYTDARSWGYGDYDTTSFINKTSCNSMSVGLGGGVKAIHATSPTTTPTNTVGVYSESAIASKLAQSSKKLNPSPNLNVAKNNDETDTNLCDINGDGLPDKLYKNNSLIKASYNLGYGFSSPITIGNGSIQKGYSYSGNAGLGFNIGEGSFMAGYGVATTFSETTCSLIDINGDGLLDKVWTDSNPNAAIHFALNMGSYFASNSGTIRLINKICSTSSTSESLNVGVTANIRILFVGKISLTPSAYGSSSIGRPTKDFRDVDGDGFLDLVSSGIGDETVKVNRSNIVYTNKLKSVSNSLGGIFTINYERSETTSDHPGGKLIMDSLTIDDGIFIDGPVIKTAFEYSGGKYDRSEREFLGFSQVKIKCLDTENQNSLYRTENKIYKNSQIFEKGLVESTSLADFSGKEIQKNVKNYYTYVVTKEPNKKDYNYFSTRFLKGYYYRTYIVFSPLQSEENVMYDNSSTSLRKNISEYVYYVNKNNDHDGHGELKEYKYCDKATNEYNYKTVISYIIPDTIKHIFGLPKTMTVYKSDVTAHPYRQMEAFYDDPVFPTHLTNIKQWIDTINYAITTIKYDNAGNIKQKVLPSGMSYTYTYDPKYNMYVTQIQDVFGYVKRLENYDYRYGIPRTSIDINGKNMTINIDDMGRIYKIKGPNEADYTLKFDYHTKTIKNSDKIVSPAYAITKHYDPSNFSNDIETVTFIDGFGRPIQVKKDGVIWDGNHNVNATIVSGMTKYDAFGRAEKIRYPIVETDTSLKTTFNESFDVVEPTKNTYDVLDRVLCTTFPDGSQTKIDYYIDLNDHLLKTTVTDPKAHSQETYTNGSDLTIKTVQSSDSLGIATLFEYDGIGQLTKLTDAKEGATTSVYDMAGRRTQVSHPASGTTTFEYDAGGNLLYKQTANLLKKGGKIEYKYDYNRLKEIIYPDHPENNVIYKYGGTSDTINNRVGRLVCLIDGSGAQEFKYGKMGEITEVRRTLVIPNQAVATYVTNWTYDSWNRVQTLTYPDGETLTYRYNTAGLLAGLTGTKGGFSYHYVDSINYDKFEQRTYMRYGNGAETRYTFDPKNLNLSNLSVLSTKINRQLMNNAYEYDLVNNVTKVTNSGLSSNDLGGTMVHNYEYDGLYRLTKAFGDFNLGNNSKNAHYDLSMSYDNLHNIISKKQDITQTNVQFGGTLMAGYDLSYAYADNSQQISSIADQSYRTDSTSADSIQKSQQYSYDANGNLISVNTVQKNTDGKQTSTNQRRLLWDEENRLLALSDNGYVSNYWYDASGERTVKTSGDGEGVLVNGILSGARTGTTNFTAYVNPYLVITNGGQCSKHFYIGSQRVVSKLCDAGTISNPLTMTRASYLGQTVDFSAKYADLTDKIKARYDSLGVTYRGTDHAGSSFYKQASVTNENQQYFYHSDHLGSSSLITNLGGDIVQHLEYVPFGEVFIEESKSTWNTPYKFNAKELDEETGLYYYGARYYDPRTSVWLSMDPLAEKYPNISSYTYCHSNPVKLIDPDGMDDYFGYDGKALGTDNDPNSNKVRIINENIWNLNSEKDKDGKAIIDPKVGQEIGVLHSQSGITDDASLKIYDYYNQTDLPLRNYHETDGKLVDLFEFDENGAKNIGVDIKTYKEKGIADNVDEIMTFFVHEGKHINDFDALGYKEYVATPTRILEYRAVQAQMEHPTWNQVRPEIQKKLREYGNVTPKITPKKYHYEE